MGVTEPQVGEAQQREPQPDLPDDPRFAAARAAGGGEEGREMLEHAAQGADLSPAEEKSALDWLLGDPIAIPHEIPVEYETPAGFKTIKFVLLKSDPDKIDEIEQRHVKNGQMDQAAADLEIVATLCDAIEDEAGKSVEIASSQFRTIKVRNKTTGEVEPHEFATPMDALNIRLRGQKGVLMGVARQIRRVAGYDIGRVGAAQRRLVEASLG